MKGLDQVVAWATANQPTLVSLMLDHGGIVLRNLPVRNSQDFDRLMSVFAA